MSELRSPMGSPPYGQDKPVLTDAQLLAQYVERREQSAFEELLRRHGPMILGVSRRVLKNHHEAEDVLQKTFLSLVQNAHRIARPEMLANWLYCVARHAAFKMRQVTLKRCQLEQRMNENNDPAAKPDVALQNAWDEVAPILDEELGKLSDKLRVVIVLCDIEGQTRRDVAQQLNCPEATVSSRLIKARSLLAGRLSRRGIVLSAATLGLLLSQNAASAAVPVSLIASTVAAASTVSVVEPTAIEILCIKAAALAKDIAQSLLFRNTGLLGAGATTIIVIVAVAIRTETRTVAPRSAERNLPSPFSEIAAAYRNHYSAVKTLKVEYEATRKELIDPEVLWKFWGELPGQTTTSGTLVVGGEKIYLKEVVRKKSLEYVANQVQKLHPERFKTATGDLQTRISYQEVLAYLVNAPWDENERIRVFDGTYLRQKFPGFVNSSQQDHKPSAVYSIADKSKIQGTDIYHFCGYSRFDLNKNDVQRLPDLFSIGNWEAVANNEPIDGVDCVVVQSDSSLKLWLDPGAGFALRRQTAEHPGKFDTVCQDLHQVTGNLWMPRRVVWTLFGDDRMPSEYLGKPCIENLLTMSIVEANRPEHDSFFTLTPSAGALVLDETLKPLDSSGKPKKVDARGTPTPIISYTQPDNPEDLSKVIKDAQTRAGLQKMDRPTGRNQELKSNGTTWLIAVNVGVLILAAGYGYFMLRRRTP